MQVSEDFKMVIVLDEDLEVGLKANTAAVLSLTIGNEVEGLIGKDLEDNSGNIHKGLTQIPLPILKCSSEKLIDLYQKGYKLKEEILIIDVTDAAQTTKNYDDYSEKLKNMLNQDLKILGVAIAGSKKLINGLTGSFGLLR
jgi:hypothetical protein